MKRVLLVSHEMTYTGAPRSLLNLAMVIRKKKMLVDVFSLTDGSFKKEFEKKGFHVRLFDEKSADCSAYDIVILNTVFTAKCIKYFDNRTKKILFVREAGNLTDLSVNCGVNFSDIEKADEVFCVSEYAREMICKVCNPKKIYVINNYVKNYFYLIPNVVRKKKIQFMISGTYEKRKGHDIAIEAFLKMPERLKKVTQLNIVGQMPEWSREFWESMREKYDCRIVEHGLISDEKKRMVLYKRMNVFIVSSRDEACSLVALEGAMLGKALVMSENVGAKYLDRTGLYIYPTNDSDSLCRLLCRLTSRKELLLRGFAARKAFYKTSTKHIYKKNFDKIIKEVF